MKIGHRLLLGACLVGLSAADARPSHAGPFMEGIVERVFATAEQEFFGGPVSKSRPAPSLQRVAPRPSTAAPVRPQPGVRRPVCFPRLFRSR